MKTGAKSAVRTHSLSDEMDSLRFRRKEGRLRTKKIQRKLKLRFRHILFSFLALTGLFLAAQQICLFAFTWEKMNIKDITVVCSNLEVKKVIEDDLSSIHLGNIFLLDVEGLKEKVNSHSRVKSVHIRKVLPPALFVIVEERQPFALLQADELHLIDNEGVVLSSPKQQMDEWLLLIDQSGFESFYSEKIECARACLESLSVQEKSSIATVDLSDYMNVKVRLKDSTPWLILGSDDYAKKLRRFRTSQTSLQQYGPLAYVDLRFDERFFIKILDNLRENGSPENEKED